MKKIILIAVLFLTACSNPEDARRTLNAAGYTDIKTQGYAMFSCGSDDFYATKFSAKNPAGNDTKGTVCSGLLIKGSTVRH